MNTSTGGRHRRQAERTITVTALTVTFAVAIATYANAAPGQPGVTAPSTAQPGVTGPAPATAAPVNDAPAPLPSTDERVFVEGYTPPGYQQQTQWRTLDESSVYTDRTPTYNGYTVYTPPAQQQSSPQPASPESSPVPPAVAGPIQAPVNKLRLGTIITDIPQWLPRDTADRINNTSASAENQGKVFFDEHGFPANRSDRLAAGATAGAVVAGAVTTAVVYVPVAALAIVGGGVIGAGIGAVAGPTVLGIVVPGVGVVPGTVIGPAVGVAGGAAVGALAAVPVAVGAGAIAAVLGGIAGATLGNADLGEPAPPAPVPVPAPVPLPQPGAPALPPVPVIDTNTVTAAAHQLGEQASAIPGAQSAAAAVDTAVNATVATWSEPVAHQVDTVRETVAARPSGADVVAAVDAAAAPVLDTANAALGAFRAGLGGV